MVNTVLGKPTRTPDGGSLLNGQHLDLRFGGTHALRDVDLTVRAGEMLGVVGPNGAGKSTLVNVLSGHVKPESGIVQLRDEANDDRTVVLTGRSPAQHWSQGISRSFQGMRLFPNLTVFENVVGGALGAKRQDFRSVRRSAEELLLEFGLTHLSRLLPGALSVGQSKLVGVLRALISNPSFILLDEPLAGLDRNEVNDFLPILRGVVERTNAGMLLIEHDLEAISSLCNRILVMSEGAIIAEGDAGVFEQTRVQEAYMGSQSIDAFQKHWKAAGGPSEKETARK